MGTSVLVNAHSVQTQQCLGCLTPTTALAGGSTSQLQAVQTGL